MNGSPTKGYGMTAEMPTCSFYGVQGTAAAQCPARRAGGSILCLKVLTIVSTMSSAACFGFYNPLEFTGRT